MCQELLRLGSDGELIAQVGDALHERLQFEAHDALYGLLAELVEMDNVVQTVEELGSELLPDGLVHNAARTLTVHLALRSGKTDAAAEFLELARADVGGHDDDGVLEVYRGTVAVGETTLVHHLKEYVVNVLMGLLYLVEQDDAVGTATHTLGELSALVVAHIARRCTHHTGDGVLLHILGHIDADESVLAAEHLAGQALAQVGLAHTRGAHEEERADGLLRVFQTHATALYGTHHTMDGLILTYDGLPERILQGKQTGALLLTHTRGGNARHHADDLGHGVLRDFTAHEMHLGTGLVHGIERLVGERTGTYEAVGQMHAGLDGSIGIGDVVVHLVVRLQKTQYLQRLLGSGLAHHHLLETAVEGSVLLYRLAELVHGGGSDAAYIAACQSRLQQIGGIHGTGGSARTHEGVYLVDENNNFGMLLEFGGDALEALLKLAAILRTGHHGGNVEHHDAAVGKQRGSLAHGDVHGQPLHNGTLAHTGFADEDGIVLLAATQYLLHTLYLLFTADDRVHLARAGQLCEVGGEGIESRCAGRAHLTRTRQVVHAGGFCLLVVSLFVAGQTAGIEDTCYLFEGDAVALQNASGRVVLLLEQSQKKMLGVHLGSLHHAGLENGKTYETGSLYVHRHLTGLGRHTDEMVGAVLLQILYDGIGVGLNLTDEYSTLTAILAHHCQQQMYG